MSYLRKDEVMRTLQEDRETTLACYNDSATREIVRFCYESMERELERLPQYVPESVVEQPKIYDVDKIVDQLEEEKEYANADFEEYAKEVEPCLDAEYDSFYGILYWNYSLHNCKSSRRAGIWENDVQKRLQSSVGGHSKGAREKEGIG